MSATILHIDLDAFYPSAEVLDDSSLAGRPVVVGGLGPRGVVASASYEARGFGIHSAMPMARARTLCPEAAYRAPRFNRYRELSRLVFAVYRGWTEIVEPLSLDEAFLDMSHRPEPGGEIAAAIKDRVHRETGLTASAGVSFNKFLAKLASDHEKPDGLTVIPFGDEREFLAPLPVERIWGVGPATALKLRHAGLETIGQMVDVPPEYLSEMLGKNGRRIADLARGIDPRAVHVPGDPKSISAEVTFDRDIASWRDAREHLHRFVARIEAQLARHDLRARTVTLKVRYADFRTVTRSLTHDRRISTAREVLDVARELAPRVPIDPRKRVRLVGLGVSNLEPAALGGRDAHTVSLPQQLDLFSSLSPTPATNEEAGRHGGRPAFPVHGESGSPSLRSPGSAEPGPDRSCPDR